MIEKQIDSFTGHTQVSKCIHCGMVANFDLEEVNHQC